MNNQLSARSADHNTGVQYLTILAGIMMVLLSCTANQNLQGEVNKNTVIGTISFESVEDLSPSSVIISTEMRNDGEVSVNVLLWNTPLEDVLSADIFTVTRDDQPVSYQGRMVKRAPPREDDYILIQPGESVRKNQNLSLSYDFSAAGRYQIQFTPPVFHSDTSAEKNGTIMSDGKILKWEHQQ